jgi:hypothetical protein
MANKPEDICVSLETAKSLHEAGIDVNPSCFYWTKITGKDFMSEWAIITHDVFIDKCLRETANVIIEWCPAPTAEEFGWEVLPDVVERNGVLYVLRITKAVNHWRVVYYEHYEGLESFPNYDHLDPLNDHSLCEVMATVAIWLKQNAKEGD